MWLRSFSSLSCYFSEVATHRYLLRITVSDGKSTKVQYCCRPSSSIVVCRLVSQSVSCSVPPLWYASREFNVLLPCMVYKRKKHYWVHHVRVATRRDLSVAMSKYSSPNLRFGFSFIVPEVLLFCGKTKLGKIVSPSHSFQVVHYYALKGSGVRSPRGRQFRSFQEHVGRNRAF